MTLRMRRASRTCNGGSPIRRRSASASAGSRPGRSTRCSPTSSTSTAPAVENSLRLTGCCERECGSVLKQTVALCPATRLGAVRNVELAIDVRQVEFHSLLGHPEHPGELRVGMSFRRQLKDLELAPGEAGRVVHFRLLSCNSGFRGTPTREIHRMRERLTHRRGEILRVRRLDYVRGSARGERGIDYLRIRVHREHDRTYARLCHAGTLDQGEAAEIAREALELRDQEVRTVLLDHRECLRG